MPLGSSSPLSSSIPLLGATPRHGWTVRLPTLPAYTIELNQILAADPVDLARLGRLMTQQPILRDSLILAARQIEPAADWEISSAGDDAGAREAERASVLLGADRLRLVALASAVLGWLGEEPTMARRADLWIRFFLTAGLARRLAEAANYPRPEEAYLAGLIHDLGLAPLLAAAAGRAGAPRGDGAWAALASERRVFGFDHCQMGGWIARVWRFPAPLAEALEFHHSVERARVAPELTALVAAADECCRLFSGAAAASDSARPAAEGRNAAAAEPILARYLPALPAEARPELAAQLEDDYWQLQLSLDFSRGPRNAMTEAVLANEPRQ